MKQKKMCVTDMDQANCMVRLRQLNFVLFWVNCTPNFDSLKTYNNLLVLKKVQFAPFDTP